MAREPIAIPYEADDKYVHTPDNHFFCDDPTCGCHEDDALIADLASAVEAGSLSADEATGIVTGHRR